jgi:hypothetical protein
MLCPEVNRTNLVIELLTEVDLYSGDVEEDFVADASAVCDIDPDDILVSTWPEHKLVAISILTDKDISFNDLWNSIRCWFKPRRWEVLT